MAKFYFLMVLLVVLIQPVRADVLVLVHGYMADARSWDVSGVNQVLALPVPVGVNLVIDLGIFGLAYILIWLALPGGRAATELILGFVRDLRPGSGTTPDTE